jgi:hypothetical protein
LLNPYVTVDVLVKQLLGIKEHIEWVELNQSISSSSLDIIFELIDNQCFKIIFTNKSKTTFILNSTDFIGKLYCLNADNKRDDLILENTFTLSPNQIGSCEFIIPNNSTNRQIHFRIEDFHLILDI